MTSLPTMKLKRPRITANTHLTGVLGRICAEFDRRLANPRSLRIALFLGDLKASPANNALIDLANALSVDHTVLICNAQPSLLDQGLLARFDSRLIPLEGTLGTAPGPPPEIPHGVRHRELSLRANRLSDLIRILRVDVLHSHSLPADRARARHRVRPEFSLAHSPQKPREYDSRHDRSIGSG